MDFFLQMIVNGVLLGALYAMVALPFSLIWGIMGTINLAHGTIIIFSSYFTLYLFNTFHLDPFAAIPITFLLFFLLGYLFQWLFLNKIARAPLFVTLLMTYGLDFVLVNIALLVWGGDIQMINPSYSGSTLSIGPITIPYTKLGVLLVSIVLTSLLVIFMNRTKIGMAIYATGQDRDVARIQGVPIRFIYALTFGIGIGMAAVAGSVSSEIFSFNPTFGGFLTLKAFCVAIIAGLQKVYNPLLGGFILGLVEAVSSIVIGSEYSTAISFILLVLVLVVRPQGLLGGKQGA